MNRLTRNLEALSGTLTERQKAASWWACSGFAFAGAVALAWLVLLFEPHDLASLGKQMACVLLFCVSVAAVLVIGAPSDEGVLP